MTTNVLPLAATPSLSYSTPAVTVVRRKRQFLVWLSMFWLAAILLIAIFANLMPIANYATPIGMPRLAPGSESLDHLLGTDSLGRSVLSRLAYGTRVSLLVGIVAGVLALVIGTLLGLLAGYYRGRLESVIMYLTDSFLAFPPLVLLLAISAIMLPSYRTLLIGLTVVVTPTFIRLARANALNWAAREFVTAATNLGAGRLRIAFREVLRNVIPSVLAFFPTVVAALIVAEGSLSFLGLGIPSPTPSWGGMIADGKDFLADSPMLVAIPSIAIFLTVFALNQVGDWARGKFDVTTQD
ncbi:ABC transporter permease [Nocardioides sp.]|uniref:ABC transporter permease n=1 Tax=Nocardioides sp. TaxID=35761 RepID=UPI0027330E44|nr:ABC transporter permease [Nocardioides sp.]MDP3892733.1 ABC transporter permease [Nocardioides sp.]